MASLLLWKMIVAHAESVLQARKNLLDDYVPTVRPDLGPTITGAMLGFSEMKLAPGTSWAVPLLDTWDKLDQVHFDPDNKWFKKCVSLMNFMIDHAKGRYMVGLPDTHWRYDGRVQRDSQPHKRPLHKPS